MSDSQIRVGTSGWSYPAGEGTWNGIFYPVPPGHKTRSAKFDELRFYAEHFDTVEVNSTFYRIPTPAVARGWTERTPPGFEFSLKLFQKFTHPQMYHEATGQNPWDLGQKDVDEFRSALDPIASAGKLGALLAQFPASFKNEPDTRAYLEWLLERFRGYPVAVELRHKSWSDQPVETLQMLDAHGAAWTQIDEPKFRFSIRQSLLPNVRTFYYLRLHGRNAAEWWRHDRSEDRYNYYYSAEELERFAEAAETAARQVKKAYLYANNHFSAKSVASAAILKHKLEQELPGGYPPEFVERYPDLKGIVRELPVTPSRKLS
ncbi:MAG: hypothetical protein A3H96_18380 [Acidobacteria bacterium RIFCSPLOWO2_02_FULL_67_36]|nr:MAG: hypothetical protein A3H96_18380 [Acidobacteria bacterium RIFCSPLOWO2_02_FULL_67_36]OFW19054.1 MAG: hypothetical protein A3G21_05000 [Acidobacteria bacterium RIFCSPLOWO2_12_FULL_66_21]